MLAWCGVSGETGRSFRQHGVPTGPGGAHAYRRSGTDRRRLCLPAEQQVNPHVSVNKTGYASMTSHCWTGRQNRLMRIQLRTCGMNSTAANRREPRTAAELWNALQEAWQQIPTVHVRNLAESVPRRLDAIRRARGENTRY